MSNIAERQQSSKYRFQEQHANQLGIIPNQKHQKRRPKDTRSVSSIKECETWRNQVSREISKKITKIEDSDKLLSEHQIRDLNDEINQLMKERGAWESRLVHLGGPNFIVHHKDNENNPREYKYFGRARELPGAEEILNKQKQRQRQQRQAHRPPKVDTHYFGFDNDTDDVLAEEQEYIRHMIYNKSNSEDLVSATSSFEPVERVEVPSSKEIEEYLMERKKQQLQSRYLD